MVSSRSPIHSRRARNDGDDLLKIQQERESELFKIQQERDNELLKIQQERDNELFKIQHLNEVEESGNAARAVGVFCREKCTTHVCVCTRGMSVCVCRVYALCMNS